ncbi:MAG: hypothetical protein KF773_13100 [Deltaproteobacteria bacterium]|nr:hypothetical protein [Deltaproteobacteria bacterium]
MRLVLPELPEGARVEYPAVPPGLPPGFASTTTDDGWPMAIVRADGGVNAYYWFDGHSAAVFAPCGDEAALLALLRRGAPDFGTDVVAIADVWSGLEEVMS